MDAINTKREQLHAIVDLSFFYHLVYLDYRVGVFPRFIEK